MQPGRLHHEVWARARAKETEAREDFKAITTAKGRADPPLDLSFLISMDLPRAHSSEFREADLSDLHVRVRRLCGAPRLHLRGLESLVVLGEEVPAALLTEIQPELGEEALFA